MKNEKKLVAVMPIKLNNERLPGKNTKLLGDKPLIQYQLDMLLQVEEVDEIYVYCSNPAVKEYLPEGVQFLQRSEKLDLPTANFSEIFTSFMQEKDADVYMYVHATAPFVTVETTKECIEAVCEKDYDSAFCAVMIQDFLWKDNKPLNFEADKVPRSQDIEPIWRETSGVYVFEKEVFSSLHRRIGNNPYIKNVSFKESIDINNPEDFVLAEMFVEEK